VSDPPARLFVPAGSCEGDRLVLSGADALRMFLLGRRVGEQIVVLDDSGWAMTITLEGCAADTCHGRVTARALAPERRTKVSLYHGLLHPSDFRRLLVAGTRLGVVAFVPLVTDASIVPVLGPDGLPEGREDWTALVRDAAESVGRGRRPSIGGPALYDHALDEALRAGTALLVDATGTSLEAALAARPFSIDLFCPPPGGFSPEERSRARAHHVPLVRPPSAGADPIQAALSALALMYDRLESAATPWSG
jgi:16S rRNA (uracil1498-N3)-methyltransferase